MLLRAPGLDCGFCSAAYACHTTGAAALHVSPILQRQSCCSGDRELHLSEPKGEAYSQAVSIVLPYLLSHRSRLAASRASETGSSVHSTSAAAHGSSAEAPAIGRSYSEAIEAGDAEPGSPLPSQPQDFLAKLQPEQQHRLSVLLDTAIFKASLRGFLYLRLAQNTMITLQL